jgi:DNA-directed RNA polymerase subunit M/transcription elongation factor TFIIS
MFKTTCPKCGEDGALYVTHGKFSTVGMNLTADGFAFMDAQQVSTEDEVVRCNACGKTTPLDELSD